MGHNEQSSLNKIFFGIQIYDKVYAYELLAIYSMKEREECHKISKIVNIASLHSAACLD